MLRCASWQKQYGGLLDHHMHRGSWECGHRDFFLNVASLPYLLIYASGEGSMALSNKVMFFYLVIIITYVRTSFMNQSDHHRHPDMFIEKESRFQWNRPAYLHILIDVVMRLRISYFVVSVEPANLPSVGRVGKRHTSLGYVILYLQEFLGYKAT